LPTLDEWEAAARAGAKTRWPWGPRFIAGRANIWNGETHEAEAAGDGYTYTAPVRSFPANAWGLYDIIGNVFEYCGDLPPSEKGREKEFIAGRGGSWWCSAGTCSFFNLVDIGHMDRHGSLSNQGFRIVLDISPRPK
jgi:sulfatase modifying factor 1